MFEKYKVLSKSELQSRYEVYKEVYDETIAIEARCTLTIAKTEIFPASLVYQSELSKTISSIEATGITDTSETKDLLAEVCSESSALLKSIKDLTECEKSGEPSKTIEAMDKLRTHVDNLEGLVPADLWPLPSYAEMMFRF